MLSNIKLTHFKCFEHLDIDCASLNLLCGLNGMGKSSVLQALLVLRQSYEAGELQNRNLVLGGERVDLGTGADVLFEDAEGDLLGFLLERSDLDEPWELQFESDRTSNLLYRSSDEVAVRQALEPNALDPEIIRLNYQLLTGEEIAIGELEPDRLDVDTIRTLRGLLTSRASVSKNWRHVPPFGGQLVYVNAERVGPRKLYPLSDALAKRSEFGAGGEYAWNYLIHHQYDVLADGDPRCLDKSSRRLIDVVNSWLQDICPGVHLELKELRDIDAVAAGFQFDRVGDVVSRWHRATNVGFGLSYVLPVIVALLSPPETLCLLENPEAHLHPRGQTKMAELAARASKAGVQVFVETHSDHFMDGIRIAVRHKLVDAEHVAFHYFGRDGNRAVVSSPKVDAEGRLSHWPTGFFDQHEENLTRLIGPRF